MSEDAVIKVNGLTRKFGDFTAVDKISFEVEKGEIFGFLGANGAGKTTSIRMLTGLLTPTSGKATVAGYDVYRQVEKIKQSIGYMSQKFSLYNDLTIKENIHFYGGIYGLDKKSIRRKKEELLEKLDLLDMQDRLVEALPLGWKQKLAFAVATLHEPKIVFLDEPTSGVDPIIRRQFWDMIYESAHYGTTIFITTHYMEEAEYCKRVSIMVEGGIAALDTPAALRSKYEAEDMDEVFVKVTQKQEQ